MDKFDYEMKTIANQEIELPNEYINMINKTLEKCAQTKTIKNHKNKILEIIRNILIALIVGASTLTVYATANKNLPLMKMGLIKAEENYAENASIINKTIENDYATITIESMSGDDAYVIIDYKIVLKDKAIQEYGNVSYDNAFEEGISLYTTVFSNSEKIEKINSKSSKISETEFNYVQVINVMNLKEISNLEIYINSLCINLDWRNPIEVNKIINIELSSSKNKKTFKEIEQKIDENRSVIITNVANTKFETYITAQIVTKDLTYKEYSEKDQLKYNSFIITNQNGEEISYIVYDGENKIYKIEDGKEVESKDIKEEDAIKTIENYIIIIGKQENVKNLKIVPIKTRLFNDRTDEEAKEYKNISWNKLKAGDEKYTAQSSLGGTLEITKIEIDDEKIVFYCKKNGLIGTESMIIRNKNQKMNYVYPHEEKKVGINGEENQIIFSRKTVGASGLNIKEGMFDNLDDIEFTLLWGEKSQRIAKDIEIEIPEQSNNIIKLKKINIAEANKIKLTGDSSKYDNLKIKKEIYYDENRKILFINTNQFLGDGGISIKDYPYLDDYIEALKNFYEKYEGKIEIESSK